jgi:hypothetical protein
VFGAFLLAAASGPALAGPIVGKNNLCASALSVNEAKVVAKTCVAGDPTQQWVYHRNGTFTIGKTDHLCLDARNLIGGQIVIVYECTRAENQTWKLETMSGNSRIKVDNKNFCLNVATLVNDEPMNIWGCHVGSHQDWRYVPDPPK